MELELETCSRPELIKCPEFLLTGFEIEKRTPLQILHKKGRRFESPWEPFFVAIYAQTLFYYANLGDWPRGIVPLVDAEVKAVDRIFRHGDSATGGEECGPCWKVTSCSGRVLLFRAPSHDARLEWIDTLRHAAGRRGGLLKKKSMDGKAALALVRRLSESVSSTSSAGVDAVPSKSMESPRRPLSHSRSKRPSEDEAEPMELLREALCMVEKQRQEILELKRRVRAYEAREKDEGRDNQEERRDERQGSEETGEEERGKASRDSTSDVEDGTPVTDEDNEDDEEDTKADEEEQEQEHERNDVEVDLSDEAAADKAATGVECKEERANGHATLAPRRQTVNSTEDAMEAWREADPADDLATSAQDVVRKDSLQQQTAELVEMARSLNKDDATDSSSTRESSDDGSLTSSFKGTQSGPGLLDSKTVAENQCLQQRTMELVEYARTLQSTFRVDTKPVKGPVETTTSSSSLIQSQSSFSDMADFCLNQINSNDSNESIFSITQDDLFFDEDDESEIERLSEFDASDSQFLEASGFLDSIHQVMKDFIASAQPDPARQSEHFVIRTESIPEVRPNAPELSSPDVTELNEAQKHRAQRTSARTMDASSDVPRKRSFLAHAKSARDFFNGDVERLGSPQSPKDLSSLVVEDTMSIVASILQSAGRDEKMLLLSPFLRVFGSRNRLSLLIRWAIEIEVASVINVATLFRSDDYASRLVSTYSKAIGSKFIRVALSDPIRQIFKLKIADMELNPHKEEMLQDETQVDSNASNLMRTCQHIIDSIMRNTHYIPSSYFHICSHLNSKVISRFDGSKEGIEAEDASVLTRSVIGGFLFLRFVCPAITTPHLYGLTKQLPPPETRRVLVLVTKLLFKTATGVKFGDREPQFRVLNPFIEKNSPAIQQLFANLAMSPSQDIDECFAADSRKIYSQISSSQLLDDLEVIRSIAEKNLDEIEKKLDECDCAPDVLEHFKSAVLVSADPLQKSSSLTKKLSANMKFLSGFGKKPRSRKQSDQ
ncbi:hypothetical protein PsorP6_004297 [Peronosclerospora sorghi]|uniref:Uncharacterized protein n=1 Tax=Peronosclerospora sorghi TaxID=230839 RepID=A0ACC0VN96_9STRA|nr:hypothetical protein PsorP6_004297 [Peronosclerospora sorghi]